MDNNEILNRNGNAMNTDGGNGGGVADIGKETDPDPNRNEVFFVVVVYPVTIVAMDMGC